MKKFVAGIVVGAALMVGGTVFADQIKQYILNEASYPIFVNGTEYKDAERPILNYEGSTYVPLAKLGDITGVNYKWNETLKRVEIDTKEAAKPGASTGSGSSSPGTLPQGGTLTPDTKVVDPKGLIEENGETVFYAYDRDGNYKGRFTDEDDASLVIASIEGSELPPRISEGWLETGFIVDIYNADVSYEGSNLIFKTSGTTLKQAEFFRFPLPEGWRELDSGETTSNGIRIKRFDGGNYFNIADLQKAGIVQ